ALGRGRTGTGRGRDRAGPATRRPRARPARSPALTAVTTRVNGPPLLAARGVTRRFGDHVALHPTDLDVRPGQALALVGPNAGGQSSFVAIPAGGAPPLRRPRRPAPDRPRRASGPGARARRAERGRQVDVARDPRRGARA